MHIYIGNLIQFKQLANHPVRLSGRSQTRCFQHGILTKRPHCQIAAVENRRNGINILRRRR